MEERELITLALGNFATLAAAQWANGTTRHDAARQTLYAERRIDRIAGGTAPLSGPPGPSSGPSGPSSGPSGLSSGPSGLSSGPSGLSSGRARVPRLVLLDAPHAARVRRVSGARCVWGDGETGDGRGEGAGEAVGLGSSSESAGEESEEDREEEAREDDEDEAFGGDGSGWERGKSNARQIRAIKRKIFVEQDDLVPWWRYISSGLCDDSVHVLHPLHRDGGAAGDYSSIHSFGFGQTQLRPSRNSDIADFLESVRRQMEEADGLQGFQYFADADSAFGGVTCNVMEEIWEDAGRKVPVALFACFQPLPSDILAHDSEVDFSDRRKDEQFLNRLLCTTQLTRNESAAYVPLELAQWRTSFPDASWLDNDVATAQCIAAVADSALYGVRDDGLLRSAVHTNNQSRPSFYLHDWVSTVRPTRSMRVCAANAAMPLQVRHAGGREDFWNLLQRYPLMPNTSSNCETCRFVPLTHAMRFGAETEAGRVLGHAVTLRGGGVLPDVTYPRTEALLRYGLPLATENYLPLATSNSYPISSSFPADFVIPNALMESVEGIDIGTHVMSTYGSAPMLQEIVADGKRVLHRRRHLYEEAYGMEDDEWREVLEEAMQIYDDYNHGGAEDEGESEI